MWNLRVDIPKFTLVQLPILLLLLVSVHIQSTSAICRSEDVTPDNFKCDWWEDLEMIRRKETVQELIIRNYLPFICDSALFVRFPQLKYLRLPGSLFIRAGPTCFNGLKRITEIDLKNNELNEFHFDSLNGSTIEYLTLNGNQLRSVNLDGIVLPRLRHLILSKNLLETLYVGPDNFGRIVDLLADNNHIHTFFVASNALKTLRISENELTVVTSDHLRSTSLQHLYLQNNRIRKISLDILRYLESVEKIFLEGNPLEVLDCSFSNVTEFTLHEEMIIVKTTDHRPFAVYLDWRTLQQLVFSGNHIRSYNLLRRLENSVQELNLDHNELTTIGEGDLATFTELFVLDLSHNRIGTIHYEAFDRLLKLHTLNLAHNCIQHLSGVLFNSLRSITSISLTTNLLTYFPIPGWNNYTGVVVQGDYHPLMGIQELKLANNPLQCDCYDMVQRWLPSLQHYQSLRHSLFYDSRMIGCMEGHKKERCHSYFTQEQWSLNVPVFIRGKNVQDMYKKCDIDQMLDASEPRRFKLSPPLFVDNELDLARDEDRD